jgi:hypothetical protein
MATADRRDRPATAHVTASIRVIRAHLQTAQRIADGTAGPNTEALRDRLEQATGCGIAELTKRAREVEKWPDSGAMGEAMTVYVDR